MWRSLQSCPNSASGWLVVNLKLGTLAQGIVFAPIRKFPGASVSEGMNEWISVVAAADILSEFFTLFRVPRFRPHDVATKRVTLEEPEPLQMTVKMFYKF